MFHRNAKSFFGLLPEQLWGVLKQTSSVHLSILDLNHTEDTGMPRLMGLDTKIGGHAVQVRKGSLESACQSASDDSGL